MNLVEVHAAIDEAVEDNYVGLITCHRSHDGRLSVFRERIFKVRELGEVDAAAANRLVKSLGASRIEIRTKGGEPDTVRVVSL